MLAIQMMVLNGFASTKRQTKLVKIITATKTTNIIANTFIACALVNGLPSSVNNS